MKFVTKLEFDAAIEIVKRAAENGQVRYGHYENPVELKLALFGDLGDNTVNASSVSFVHPREAAQGRLISTRNELNRVRKNHEASAKELASLEKTEKELANLVAVLKE
jgi:hypothetical protein